MSAFVKPNQLKDFFNMGIPDNKPNNLKGKKRGINDFDVAIKLMARVSFASIVVYIMSIVYMVGIVDFKNYYILFLAFFLISAFAFWVAWHYFYFANPLRGESYITFTKYNVAKKKEAFWGFFYYSKNMKIDFFQNGLIAKIMKEHNCTYEQSLVKEKELLKNLDKKVKDDYFEKYYLVKIVLIAHTMVRSYLGISFVMFASVTFLESIYRRNVVLHEELLGVMAVLLILFLVLYIRNRKYEDHLKNYSNICNLIIDLDKRKVH